MAKDAEKFVGGQGTPTLPTGVTPSFVLQPNHNLSRIRKQSVNGQVCSRIQSESVGQAEEANAAARLGLAS